MQPIPAPDASPATQSVLQVAAAEGVDPSSGLEPSEAARRLAAVGPNVLAHVQPKRLPEIIAEAVREPFIVLLFGAGGLAVLLGEVRDGLLILVALLPIVAADIVTEYRGERALDALRAASAPMARVRRGGGVADIPSAGLVPGDLVLLRAGDVVPADLRVSLADRLVIDRSVLTGESVPEPAAVAPDGPATPLNERRAMAFAGTSVVGGRGEGIVVATGRATEVGRIAQDLERRRDGRRSPLQQELDRLVRLLLVAALALIAVVTILGFSRGEPLGRTLLAGISAAIAAIPEEPPVLVAVVLGLGAFRLLRRGVLVRRLNAEEVLGAVDLIVSDKTGTLTQNRLAVSGVLGPDGPVMAPERRRELLVSALRAEEDAWAHGAGVRPGSFTSALREAVSRAGGDPDLDPAQLVAAEPVVHDRPLSVTRAHRDGRVESLAIGAPEHVIGLAAPALGEDDRTAWEARLAAGTASGQRLVGLARRESDDDTWRILALVAFADPVRPHIATALAATAAAGIQTIVVTGDHPATAAAIATAAGLPAQHLVTGAELAAWPDERVVAELPGLHVVARSTPDQKQRLVRLARAAGRIVAVTGDGVNDAPALNDADVAVAMGSGTAVAREAADLVLGDDSFETLTFGLAEGRRLVDNIQKGLVFLVSTHVALLGFIFLATTAGISQPLLPLQILWMELFIDLSASVAFEREPPEPDVMNRPPRAAGRPLLGRGLLTRILAAGSVGALGALWIVLAGGGDEHARWVAFTALVASQVVRAYANRSLRTPLHRLRPNGFLLAAAAVAIGLQALIPVVPPLAEAFRASPLSPAEWLVVVVLALAPAIVAELARTVRSVEWVA